MKNIKNDLEKIRHRNPGIDLIRLIASYLIVLTHFIFYGNIIGKYQVYKNQILTLHFSTDWHNNAFALISGIIGFKTNKYSNLLYLWLTVFFYSFGIHIFFVIFLKKYKISTNISKECFPIIFQRYWYFTAYFGMYLFLPIINKGISSLTKYEMKLIIISLIGIFVLWRDFKNPKNDIFNLNSGYSLLWLLVLYITGAYIGKYKNNYLGNNKFLIFFVYIFLYTILTYIFIKININELNSRNEYFKNSFYIFLKKMFARRFDSFLKTTQSILICLFFINIQYNSFIEKITSCFGPLSFRVFLIHFHPLINGNITMHSFENEQRNISLNYVLIILFLKTTKMYIFCLFIDYIRNKLFILLRIRKVCIFLETKLNTILIKIL